MPRSRAEYNKVDHVPHGAEENVERVDVEVIVARLASDRSLACASAWETAERYGAALVNGLDSDLGTFSNIKCEGDAGFIAIGAGMVEGKGDISTSRAAHDRSSVVPETFNR